MYRSLLGPRRDRWVISPVGLKRQEIPHFRNLKVVELCQKRILVGHGPTGLTYS